MTNSFQHKCIKPGCPNTYTDNDPDPYFCQSCNEIKKVIAKKIDEKFAGIPKKPVESDIARYDRLKGDLKFIPYKLL